MTAHPGVMLSFLRSQLGGRFDLGSRVSFKEVDLDDPKQLLGDDSQPMYIRQRAYIILDTWRLTWRGRSTCSVTTTPHRLTSQSEP